MPLLNEDDAKVFGFSLLSGCTRPDRALTAPTAITAPCRCIEKHWAIEDARLRKDVPAAEIFEDGDSRRPVWVWEKSLHFPQSPIYGATLIPKNGAKLKLQDTQILSSGKHLGQTHSYDQALWCILTCSKPADKFLNQDFYHRTDFLFV